MNEVAYHFTFNKNQRNRCASKRHLKWLLEQTNQSFSKIALNQRKPSIFALGSDNVVHLSLIRASCSKTPSMIACGNIHSKERSQKWTEEEQEHYNNEWVISPHLVHSFSMGISSNLIIGDIFSTRLYSEISPSLSRKSEYVCKRLV